MLDIHVPTRSYQHPQKNKKLSSYELESRVLGTKKNLGPLGKSFQQVTWEG